MMTIEENKRALRSVKHCLISAHKDIESIADHFELQLTTEQEQAASAEYMTVCRILGIFEEQIANIRNQINGLR